MRKQEKGITLIALVVTIVVLLILAATSIAMLTGENGIITEAVKSQEENEKAEEKEKIQLAAQAAKSKTQWGEITQENLESELNSNIGSGKYTLTKDGDKYTVTYTDSNRSYEINSNGNIEEKNIDIWDGETIEKPEVDESGNWHIYTASQMKFFANYCNDELTDDEKAEANMPEITSTTIIYLENNLDMGARQEEGELVSGTQWTPINRLMGNFDGKEHYISGIYSKGSFANGVFAMNNIESKIQNLTIKNSYIESTYQRVGGIVGMNMGEVINCHNINTIVKSSMDVSYVGGIVGVHMGTTISGCTNTGEVSGKEAVGGIGGGIPNMMSTIQAQIENCSNSGKITGDSSVGGIIGKNSQKLAIKNCSNEGIVIGSGDAIGGIIGQTSETGTLTIEGNYNKGTIKGINQVGGIIGKNPATSVVTKCYNKGAVEGTTKVGSVIGEQLNGNDNLSKLYYLSTLNIGGVDGEDITDKVEGVIDDIKSYEAFVMWIKGK